MAKAKKKRRPPKRPVENGRTLRGAKEVLSHLRVSYGVIWHRVTLYRRRVRPNDPFPGVLILIERRALFVTNERAVEQWAHRNLEMNGG